ERSGLVDRGNQNIYRTGIHASRLRRADALSDRVCVRARDNKRQQTVEGVVSKVRRGRLCDFEPSTTRQETLRLDDCRRGADTQGASQKAATGPAYGRAKILRCQFDVPPSKACTACLPTSWLST